jgi:hypothetical protein
MRLLRRLQLTRNGPDPKRLVKPDEGSPHRPDRRRPPVHLARRPRFESSFSDVAGNLPQNALRARAAQIFMSGAKRSGFGATDFKQADAPTKTRKVPGR